MAVRTTQNTKAALGLGAAAVLGLALTVRQGGDALSLLPLPVVALASILVHRSTPREWVFLRTFTWSLALAYVAALAGVAGGFAMFGWLVAASGLTAAVAQYRLKNRRGGLVPVGAEALPPEDVAARSQAVVPIGAASTPRPPVHSGSDRLAS